MTKKLFAILSVLLVASMLLAACAKPAPTEAPATEAPVVEEPAAAAAKVCQITDTGGIDDKSFNATAWKGVTMPWLSSALKANTLNPKQTRLRKEPPRFHRRRLRSDRHRRLLARRRHQGCR